LIKVESSENFVKYINAFYFSTVTMVTVGYGDVRPGNELEKFVSILTIMMSCGVYAYCLNMVGVIFQELQKPKTELLRKF